MIGLSIYKQENENVIPHTAIAIAVMTTMTTIIWDQHILSTVSRPVDRYQKDFSMS